MSVGMGKLSIQASPLQGVRWLSSLVHHDQRGYFFEGYRETTHRAISGDFSVQTNISMSNPNVMRAFHWHRDQFDFWAIASGMAQVVVQTFQGSESRVLSVGQGVIIPPHTGHGFLALSEMILIYNVTAEFQEEAPDEQGYSANSFDEWLTPIDKAIRSERDIAYDTGSGFTPW